MLGLKGIRGVLIDVDGTLLVQDRAVAGAAETLSRLRRAGIALRVTTNTTRRPRSAVAAALALAGLDLERDEILSPAILARRRILDSGRRRAALLVPEASFQDFESVVIDENAPEWVVMGDLGPAFSGIL